MEKIFEFYRDNVGFAGTYANEFNKKANDIKTRWQNYAANHPTVHFGADNFSALGNGQLNVLEVDLVRKIGGAGIKTIREHPKNFS